MRGLRGGGGCRSGRSLALLAMDCIVYLILYPQGREGGTYAIPPIKIVTLFAVGKEFPGPCENWQFTSAGGS